MVEWLAKFLENRCFQRRSSIDTTFRKIYSSKCLFKGAHIRIKAAGQIELEWKRQMRKDAGPERKSGREWKRKGRDESPCHPFEIIHPNLFSPGLSKPIKADPFQQTEWVAPAPTFLSLQVFILFFYRGSGASFQSSVSQHCRKTFWQFDNLYHYTYIMYALTVIFYHIYNPQVGWRQQTSYETQKS